MKYFRAEEDSNARLPGNFIEGFLEVSRPLVDMVSRPATVLWSGKELVTRSVIDYHYLHREGIETRVWKVFMTSRGVVVVASLSLYILAHEQSIHWPMSLLLSLNHGHSPPPPFALIHRQHPFPLLPPSSPR